MPARSFSPFVQEVESPETGIPQDEGATLEPAPELQAQESPLGQDAGATLEPAPELQAEESPFSIPDSTGDISNQPVEESGKAEDDIFSTGQELGKFNEGEAKVLVTPDQPSRPIVEESFLGSPSFWFMTIPLLIIPFVIYAMMNSMSRRKVKELPKAEPAIEVDPEKEVRGQFKKAERFRAETVDRQSFDKSLDEFDQSQPEFQEEQVLSHLAHANRTFGSDPETYRSDASPIKTKDATDSGLETRRVLLKPAGEHGGDLYLEVSFRLDQSDPQSSLDDDEEFDYSAEIEEIKRVWELANPDPVALSDEPSLQDSFNATSDLSDSEASTLRANVRAVADDTEQMWPSQNDLKTEPSIHVTEDEFRVDSDEDLYDDDSAFDLDHVMENERLTIDGVVVNDEELESEINAVEQNHTSFAVAEDSVNTSEDESVMDLRDDDSNLDLGFDVLELEAENSDSMEFTDNVEMSDDSQPDYSKPEGSADDQPQPESHGLATHGAVAGAATSSSMFTKLVGWMKRTPLDDNEIGSASTTPSDESVESNPHSAQPNPADFALGAPASIVSEPTDESDAVDFGSSLNLDDSAEVELPNLDLDEEDFPKTESPSTSADTLPDSELDDNAAFKSAETLRAPETGPGTPVALSSNDTLTEVDVAALMNAESSANTLPDVGPVHDVQLYSPTSGGSADTIRDPGLTSNSGFENDQLLNLQSRIDELERENDALTASLNNRNSEAEQAIQSQIDCLTQENVQLSEALETEQAETNRLAESLSSGPTAKELDEFAVKLETAELANSELQSELDSVKLALKELKIVQESAHQATEERKVEFAELQAQLEAVTGDNETLKTTHQELANTRTELEAAKSEQVQNAELQSKLDAASKEIEALESTRAELANTRTELEAARSEQVQIAELQSKLDAASKEIEALESTRAELANTRTELEAARSEQVQIAELQSKLDAASKEIEALESTRVELKDSRTELESARMDLEKAKSELDSMRLEFQRRSESGTLSELSNLEELNSNLASGDPKAKISIDADLLTRFEKRLKAEYARRKEVQACLVQAEQQRDEAAAELRQARRDATSSAESITAGPAAESRSAKKDDLTRISGIGPKIKKKLFNKDVSSFDQIAEWNDQDVARFEEILSLRNRIGSEDWVGQAKELANAKKKS